MGGTSVAAPLVAAAFTVLGLAAADPSFPWSHAADFFDVVQGSNGTCDSSSFCNAAPGYDGPTGWGTLNGTLLALAAAQGTSRVEVDAGGSVVEAAGTAKGAGTAPIADAGRDTGADAVADAASHVPEDAGSYAANDAASHPDAAAKSDAGAVERVGVPEASADSASGEGPAPSVAGGFECSLGVRASRTQVSELAFMGLAALAVVRRRRRSA
jgi:hypothetical protein